MIQSSFRKHVLCIIVLILAVSCFGYASTNEVVINEIAWMGTTYSHSDEWIELYNTTDHSISLVGWTLTANDGSPYIELSGEIPSKGYFLLEKTDDNSVLGIDADQTYSGTLGNSGEILDLRDASNQLIDSVTGWHAGDNSSKSTMERTNPILGNELSNWNTSTKSYNGGLGTPKAINSTTVPPVNETDEQINTVSDTPGAINVYFNKSADTSYAYSNNKANYNVNLENRLVSRINESTQSIDIATYEINLPGIINALMNRAAADVDVRMIADAKNSTDPHYAERYELMRLNLEKALRGLDGVYGTDDDITIFSDSPILAVTDQVKRTDFGLPSTPNDLNSITFSAGTNSFSGRMIADAELKSTDTYYSPSQQMHNKFLIIDDKWVWTGSWNFTVTGLYGSEDNMTNNKLGGNTQHAVELYSTELAKIFEDEFNEMWGSSGLIPNINTSDFHGRKTDNTSHRVTVGEKVVEVYFSPGDNAIQKLRDLVKNDAQYSAYFSIFAWSDQGLVDELKHKYEGSYSDQQGTLTGFKVKGVFDSSFWNQWWSASVDMTGRTGNSSVNNPNIRWNNPAPVYKDVEERKLHSKTLIIDGESDSDPTVVVGSTNWSNNGNDINDENLLIIHDKNIANQFIQEFYSRYLPAASGQ